MRTPSEYIYPCEEALSDVVAQIKSHNVLATEPLHLGFIGCFGSHCVSPRELCSTLLETLVCVRGVVTKCSLVQPQILCSVHHCATSGTFVSRDYQTSRNDSHTRAGMAGPKRDEDNNPLTTEYGLSTYRDHQVVTIQELPESAPAGQLPRSIDIWFDNDLVDQCKPGDRVNVAGIFKTLPGISTSIGTFRSHVMGISIQQLKVDSVTTAITQEEIEKFHELADSEPSALLGKLGASVAPSICGFSVVKKALVLLLIGGEEKALPNGTHLRGDINCLLVGDPSVAKSQLLRAVMNVAPLAISTTGRGSSGAGLTAAITIDSETAERRLEAGAMVLADRGVVCIDEFDKMSDNDRVAIHEVMEQQTVTIAKAGIHCSLNARCSVLAAANPLYGSYDHNISVVRNVALPDSLLSRFDLLFVMLDPASTQIDRSISKHVLQLHTLQSKMNNCIQNVLNNHTGDFKPLQSDVTQEHKKGTPDTQHSTGPELLSIKCLKKYLQYARERPITPMLTEAAMTLVAATYTSWRSLHSRSETDLRTLPVTARTLETVVRLAAAHAKMRLSSEIELTDAEEAINIMKDVLFTNKTVAGQGEASGTKHTSAPHFLNSAVDERVEAGDNSLHISTDNLSQIHSKRQTFLQYISEYFKNRETGSHADFQSFLQSCNQQFSSEESSELLAELAAKNRIMLDGSHMYKIIL